MLNKKNVDRKDNNAWFISGSNLSLKRKKECEKHWFELLKT